MYAKWALVLALCILCVPALAASGLTDSSLQPSGVLNRMANAFTLRADRYATPIKDAARSLFWSLTGFALFVNGVKLIFKDGDIQSFAGVMVRMILFVGIFSYLLEKGSYIGITIIDSLSGLTSERNMGPSELLDVVFNSSQRLRQAAENASGSIPSKIGIYLMLIVFDLILFHVVVRYVSLYLNAYVMCVCGVFVLGFGAFSYTRDLAVNYMRLSLSLGLQLMAMTIVCQVGAGVLEDIGLGLIHADSVTMQDLGVVLFSALFLHALSGILPHTVGQLVTGAGVQAASSPLTVRLPRINLRK